jgi:uncharacterized protein (DUF58 family)
MLSRFRPHIPALTYLVLTLLVGVSAMNNQNNLLFWVFGMLVAALALSMVLATAVIRSAQVRRIDPRYGAVGEPLVMRYAITNRSRWMSVFNVHVEETPGRPRKSQQGGDEGDWQRLMKPAGAWVMHAGPRETVHGEAVYWPHARGEAVFDRLRVWTTFPFGLIHRSRRLAQPQHTLIYPMLYELRRGLLGSIAPIGLMGSRIAHHAGAGDDYFGLREYRPGDSMRHISWKRTARTDQLVTIERTTPAPAKLRVVLDLTTPTDRLPIASGDRAKARETEERAISLAASLIHAADLEGFEVGLTVLGVRDAPPIAVRRNQWHFHKMMAALAEIDLDGERTSERPMPVRDAERAAMVVIAPDRVQPLGGREDALYLTAASLENLAVRPLGWPEAGAGASTGGPVSDRRMPPSASATAKREAQEVAA